jgi:hypothetical protein
MSTATDFLNGWVQENVNATMYEDTQMAEHLANDCLWEAKKYGITEAELMEAAGGNLKAYMLAELNRAVDHAVEDRG